MSSSIKLTSLLSIRKSFHLFDDVLSQYFIQILKRLIPVYKKQNFSLRSFLKHILSSIAGKYRSNVKKDNNLELYDFWKLFDFQKKNAKPHWQNKKVRVRTHSILFV